MEATVFEIAGGSARPPLVKGEGTKRLGKGRVKNLSQPDPEIWWFFYAGYYCMWFHKRKILDCMDRRSHLKSMLIDTQFVVFAVSTSCNFRYSIFNTVFAFHEQLLIVKIVTKTTCFYISFL